MKHWHRCRRWRRLGMRCPLRRFTEHEDDGPSRDLDAEEPQEPDRRAVPPPPPGFLIPFLHDTKKDDDEEDPQEVVEDIVEQILQDVPDPERVLERLVRGETVEPVGKKQLEKREAPKPITEPALARPRKRVAVGAPADRLGDFVAREIVNGAAGQTLDRPTPRRGGQFRTSFTRPEDRPEFEAMAERSEVALTDELMIEARDTSRRPRRPVRDTGPVRPAPRTGTGAGGRSTGGRGGGGGFHFRFLDRIKQGTAPR